MYYIACIRFCVENSTILSMNLSIPSAFSFKFFFIRRYTYFHQFFQSFFSVQSDIRKKEKKIAQRKKRICILNWMRLIRKKNQQKKDTSERNHLLCTSRIPSTLCMKIMLIIFQLCHFLCRFAILFSHWSNCGKTTRQAETEWNKNKIWKKRNNNNKKKKRIEVSVFSLD